MSAPRVSRVLQRFITVPIVLFSLHAQAHPPVSEADSATLDTVVVKGEQLRAEDSSFSATVLGNQTIREQAYADIDDLFRLVPGMAVRDFQLGTVANSIVIRGFGNGGHGGDLGVVVDGIPLNEAMSHADGYVDLNVLIPLEIDSMSVFKGPVSALYGNYNRGGLLNIQTRKSGDYAEADLALGSFETADLQAAYGAQLGERQQLNLAGRLYRTDGFRPQSETRRGTLSGRWGLMLTPDLELAVRARAFDAESDSASYMTEAQFQDDPEGIDPRVQNDGADKDFVTLRTDLNYRLSPTMKLLSFAYMTQQDFTRWFTRPVGEIWQQREESYDRDVWGAGTSLNGLTAVSAIPLGYVVGVETFNESTEFVYFDGTDHRQRVTPAISDRETTLDSVSAFGELRANLHRLAHLSLGLRADRFSGECTPQGAETGSDPCDELDDAEHLSPKIGFHSQLNDVLQLRTSWSEGFALSNGFVKYAVGGQPLDENVFRQTEIGARVELSATLLFDIAAYRLTSTGEVRTVAPGIYENFGETERSGIEASLMWSPTERLDLTAVYGATDSEIEKNADASLEGLEVPGVPEDTATVSARFDVLPQWILGADWRHVGAYHIDAGNTQQAEAYDLFDVTLAYTPDTNRYRVYARVDNLTDEDYATAVFIIGGQRLYAPGAPRSVQVGIQYNF